MSPVAPLRPGRFLLAAMLVVAACSSEPDAPGAVTADEERQLNEAAAMLDANSVTVTVDDSENEAAP